MNRIEDAATRLVSGTTDSVVKPLAPATSEMPIATFQVFAAAFTVAYAVAHAVGPSVSAETAAYRGVTADPADLSGGELLKMRHEAVAR